MGRTIALLVLAVGLALALDAGYRIVAAPFVDGVPLPPEAVLTSAAVFLVGTVIATRGLVALSDHRSI